MRSLFVPSLIGLAALAGPLSAEEKPLMDRVEHLYADNNGVKIHYASLGSGAPLVFIHGFPDFWYSWRHQMEGLADAYRVVAMDLRGYNLSDKPAGQANYAMPLLVSDVVAVIKSLGVEKATVVGHDWGGAIAWATAMNAPDVVERLIILNLPHPKGLSRELANNPEQQKNSEYARKFQEPDAHTKISGAMLAMMVAGKDPAALPHYKEAFERSDMEAMLNYYKENYPREPYVEAPGFPRVKAPVLQFHGLGDKALLPGALNDTWNWLDGEFTLVTIPGAGHWVQHDAAATVTETMRGWLARH